MTTTPSDRSVFRAHDVIRAFVRSATSAAGEDPAALVALLRHTLPAHFAIEERTGGFFERLGQRGIPADVLDQLRADHRGFLEQLEALEIAVERGDDARQALSGIAEALREHEWIESASAVQVDMSVPMGPANDTLAQALPAEVMRSVVDVADEVRTLASRRKDQLLRSIAVAVPAHLSSETVRAVVENELSERGIDFVAIDLQPVSDGDLALRGVQFRPSPSGR